MDQGVCLTPPLEHLNYFGKNYPVFLRLSLRVYAI